MSEHYVYILKCSDGTLYSGYTNDLENRLKTHNSGKGSKYTRARLPVEYAFHLKCKDKSDALKKECFIKSLERSKKIKIINGEEDLNELYNSYLEKKGSKL
ncbi:GIY-YIG nuclease family protein [Peptoniphilus sp.]|jgi:putative endonuclease|uniref:GIY-YIG nuclease family protein n=1 Tax=Peptoniphilus sp. TaxID=1971214 RepID=UPI003D918ED2